ncbi:MAG TPA: SDR family oxidoreductase [Dehalococcoidia bacterium]|nr:SDR family oxidoreductase [Dehalococcoidia bacterium]
MAEATELPGAGGPGGAAPGQPRLAGKVAIVTGAGSRGPGTGNGKAMALLFAREGARVLLVDQQRARAEETLTALGVLLGRDAGETAAVSEADVTDPAQAEALVAEAERRFGPLTTLVNNVGIESRGSILDTSPEDWDRVMTVNLRSMYACCRAAIPRLAAHGGGAILNISSVSGMRGRGNAPYAASKGGVIALSTTLAIQHAAQGIRVNCIAPGPVYTPMVAGGMAPETRAARLASVPLGAVGLEGTAWDIGWAAVFLCSDEARWITGVTLPVDGGSIAATRRA